MSVFYFSPPLRWVLFNISQFGIAMHAKASFVFWTTLFIYVITLFSVSYVGVYLTYIALPILLLAGLVMKLTTPKPEHKEIQDNISGAVNEALEVTSSVLNSISSGLGTATQELNIFNEKMVLKQQKTKLLTEQRLQLKLEMISSEADIISLNGEAKALKEAEIKILQNRLVLLDQQIDAVKQACEEAVDAKYDTK
ncbi:hypothetical protein ACRN96_09300 [Shewanella oncorhynchi]|uniref:hypothetical protein n=1 Tax=Shewanella oncorhynchi TaxID=2726434 RepID=UPI003D79D440